MAEPRPRVWVSQPLFDDIVGRLAAHFDVPSTAGVTEHSPEAIADALRDSVGALVTLNERIGPREIAGAERLRAIAEEREVLRAVTLEFVERADDVADQCAEAAHVVAEQGVGLRETDFAQRWGQVVVGVHPATN